MSLKKIINTNKVLKNIIQNVLNEVEEKDEFINTGVIPLNILFSGRINGGIPKHKISEIAGESGAGKSLLALILTRNALKDGMDVIYIDTEYAINSQIIDSFKLRDKIKEGNFVLYQENNIIDIKQFLSNIKKELSKDDLKNLLIVIDSWGMLTTNKMDEDSEKGKDVADLQTTRAKNNLAVYLSSFYPATIFVSNHTYSNIGGFGDKTAISGGTKLEYVSSAIVQTTSKAKDKNSSGDIEGVIVTAKTFKSRYAKKDSKLKFQIKFNGIVHPVYGLLDDAIECKLVEKTGNGYYTRTIVKDDKKWRERELYNNYNEFWKVILKNDIFIKHIEKKYKLQDIQDLSLEISSEK